jgi:superfamily II DNA or RNA helicase
VLDELDEHLDDNHLHIIAPPGSGKTILGLEVALRLNKPTLIFAPTIAIRNQWIQRFVELFLQASEKPNWISTDIKKPRFFTVVTYQALHAAISVEQDIKAKRDNDENGKEITSDAITNTTLKKLKEANIGSVVVDEAHHLKNAWWRSLSILKRSLNPTIVGLTATPPYDVTYAEWQRYTELNGPVDAEISIPELVVEGDLCPHQDYIYFSRPTFEEEEKINTFRKRVALLFDELKSEETLIKTIENHPIFKEPNQYLDWIYSNIEYYSTCLIYLNANGIEITQEHLNIVGEQRFLVPELNYEWMENLLSFYLYKDFIENPNNNEHKKKLLAKLKRKGVLEGRSIRFQKSRKINTYLSSSISKLQSIDNIVDFEYRHLGSDLRMVVLTDYIRKEFYVKSSSNDLLLNKIGVLPIFEQLRRTNDKNIKLGVLTGSLIIIPVSSYDALCEISDHYSLPNIPISPLPFDTQYYTIKTNEQNKNDIVSIITQLFQEGNIEVIIGTKSLLGEGWDAPSINSLILASFVGSYVLSNQMRGRAIRTKRLNKAKTSNIWHLVCIDPSSEDGGHNMQLMKRRFKAFVGVSFNDNVRIENGFERLNIQNQVWYEEGILAMNKMMLQNAGERELLKEKWNFALKKGNILIEEIKIPFPKKEDYQKIKTLYYNRTLKYMLGVLISGLVGFSYEALQVLGRSAKYIKSTDDLINWLMIIGGIGILLFGGLAISTFRAYIKYRDISKDVQWIGEALLASLVNEGSIKTAIHEMQVVSSIDGLGAIYCHLNGGSSFEKSLFIKSLQELISSVDNPRYIILRKSILFGLISQTDYHAVPEVLGRKKHFAQFFESQWRRMVGSCELIYTRTIEGRRLLLKSRIQSLSSEFEDKTERINKWK